MNGLFTLTVFPAALSYIYTDFGREVPANLAQLPIVSLGLGAAGAVAVVSLCAVLSRFRLAGFLRYLGSHSIVVYLAFFLPMVITREILFRFAPWIDLGTMSLIVLAASVVSAVIAWEFTRLTGWFRFLFIRPDWTKVERRNRIKDHKASLQPAE